MSDEIIIVNGLETRTWTYNPKWGYGCAECCNGDRCDDDCTARYRRPGCPHCKGRGWIDPMNISGIKTITPTNMSIATKCICGSSLNGFCTSSVKECKLLRKTPTNMEKKELPVELAQQIEKEAEVYANSSAGESDAVEFAEWLYENRWFNKEGDFWCYTFEQGTLVSDATYRKNYMKTTAELYTIFKQQKSNV